MSEKSEMISKLVRNKQTREAYIRSKVSTNVASQVRALRRRRNNLTQQALAREAEMKQSRISAVERPGTSLNVETLVRLAAALKVGLTIKFESFTDMVNWENEFSQDEFDVITIDEDVDFCGEEVPAAFADADFNVQALAAREVNLPQGEGRYEVLPPANTLLQSARI